MTKPSRQDRQNSHASLTLGEPHAGSLSLHLARRPHRLVNPKGNSVRKALLRTPVDGAKITSGFGMRMHPILGYSLMHKGVDFGAPIGTPIYAAGDGVVQILGPVTGYGNYIRLKHTAATYGTAYGHITRFAAGLHVGSRVHQGQVIAYVGMTGAGHGTASALRSPGQRQANQSAERETAHGRVSLPARN